MSDLSAREVACDFLLDFVMQRRDHSAEENNHWIDKLTEIMETREAAAENDGREEIIDKGLENVMLHLQVKHLLPVVEAARQREGCEDCGGHGVIPRLQGGGDVDFEVCDCSSRMNDVLTAYDTFAKEARL